MRKFICSFFLILTALLSAPSGSDAQAPSSDAPYLYYYSGVLNAFVIERADGTDSHVLGAGVLPDDMRWAGGPLWSPSSKWFAGNGAIDQDPFSHHYDQPYLFGLDGKYRSSALEGLSNARMAWSPKADLLFVSAFLGESYDDYIARMDGSGNFDRRYANVRMILINPAEDKIIASIDKQLFTVIEPPPPLPDFFWTQDGQHIIAYYQEMTSTDPATWKDTFEIFDTHGGFTEKVLPSASIASIGTTGLITYQFTEDKEIVTEDLISGQQQVFTSEHLQETAFDEIESVHWSEDRQYGLVSLIRDGCDGGICNRQILLLDTQAQSVEIVLSEIIQRSPLTWSADSRHAIIGATGNEGFRKFYHYEPEKRLLTELQGQANDGYVIDWYWSTSGQFIIIDKSTPDTLIVFVHNLEAATHAELRFSIPSLDRYASVRLSADQQYLIVLVDSLVEYYLPLGIERTFPPDSRSFGSVPGGKIEWHPEKNWLILTDDGTIAGAGPFYQSVMNAEGTVRRELGSRWIAWLPVHLDVARIPSVSQAHQLMTQLTLHGSAWSCLLSWTPDGKQLLTAQMACDRADEREMVVWNLENATVIATFPDADDNETVEWQVNIDGSYVPVVIEMAGLEYWNDHAVLAHAPDGSHLLVWSPVEGRGISVVQVYDPTTGTLLKDLGRFNPVWATTFSYSPDGNLLAIADVFTPVQIWDTQTWEVLATLPTPSPAVAFSPDGTQLAVASSWDIQIWDVAELLVWGASQ